jgi:hypothetical protein
MKGILFMTFTAPKLLAGLISALLGFTAFLGPDNAQSSPSRVTLDVAPFLIEPTTTTSSTLFIDPYATAAEQFAALAVNLGWPVEEYNTLVKVITRESNGIAIAHNSKDPMTGSYGLMQINGVNWDPKRSKNAIACVEMKICTQAPLLDAVTNLKVGKLLYDRSNGWGPWDVCRWNPSAKSCKKKN